MILTIDTREQKPLDFSSYEFVEGVKVSKLEYGDYACSFNDKVVPVVFERKSLGDLFGTLGKGYKRFKSEINLAKADEVILVIIVEVDLLNILKGYKHSKMTGIGVIRTLFTLLVKHRIPFVCCKNREEMALYIAEFYYSYIKNMGEICQK